jgi:hypothetical protein
MVDEVTEYDLGHLEIYRLLLVMTQEGATDESLCLEVLNIDPNRESKRAREVLRQHLDRARWMTTDGYRHLVRMGS